MYQNQMIGTIKCCKIFNEDGLRQMIRVNFVEFDYILSLIKDDSGFKNKTAAPQLPVQMQLQITLYRLGSSGLYRLGSSGEGASIRKISSLFGVGDGGTVQIVASRVLNAILKLKSGFVSWPNTRDRRNLVAKTINELPQCIGCMDGTEISLAESPSKHHEMYFSRKKQYSIKMQVVCDYMLKIRAATVVCTTPRFLKTLLWVGSPMVFFSKPMDCR